MSQKIELPDEIYDALNATARAEGITPVEWLEKNLRVPANINRKRPLAEYLAGMTGTIDSSTQPRGTHQPTPFSIAIAEKFTKQGLKRP